MRIKNKISGPGGYHVNVWGRPTVLMGPEGDGGSGGSGGDGESDDDKKLTTKINEVVHKALSERDKRFETNFDKKLTKSLEAATEKITNTLSEKLASMQTQTPEKKTEPPAETSAQLTQLQKQVKDLMDSNAEFKRKAEESEQKSRKTEEINSLTQLLSGAVKPTLLDMTVGHLHASNITRDPDTGTILWKVGDNEYLPLKDGVEAWKKTEAAKELAPPRDAKGAGDKGGGAAGKTSATGYGYADLGAAIGGGKA